MKTYPEFIQFYDCTLVRKVRLYNVDPDTCVAIYYNLITNFQIGVGWSILGLATISSDPYLNDLKCYEITKAEFNAK